MKINRLTHLAFYLNGAAGSGKYDDISIDQVKAAIDGGTVFEFLAARLKNDLDLSILTPEERHELVVEWQSLVNAVDEARKMCVDRGGLCLLVAYLLEGIQRRSATYRA